MSRTGPRVWRAAYTCGVRLCQYADDVEDDDYPRPRQQKASKRKSAKKPISQVERRT